MKFEAIARTSTVEAVIEAIREKIQTGELVVGDALPSERELSESFNVSRTTLREAFRVLEAYGVIETRQKAGATVVNRGLAAALRLQSFHLRIDRETFLDIQHFRRLVEVGSMRAVIARITPAETEEIRGLVLAMGDDLPSDRLAEMDFQFHYRLVEIAGNRTTRQIFDILERPVVEMMKVGKEAHGNAVTKESHLAILDAIEAGDAAEAERQMWSHLEIGLRYLSADEKEQG